MLAPEWTFLDWPMSVWAVLVAATGVVASTLVAIAAFTASARANSIAIQNRADSNSASRRHERREFYDAAMIWLDGEKPNIVSHGVANYPHRLGWLAHVIDSDTAPKLATWLYDGARLAAAESSVPDRKVAYNALVQLFGDQCALWVKDAKNNYKWPPFVLPAPPSTP